MLLLTLLNQVLVVLILNVDAESKLSQFDHSFINQDVFGFDVSMDDVEFPQLVHSTDDLD